MTKIQLDQLVKQCFDIDYGMLSDRADDNDYWSNAFDFYISVMDCFMEEMSDKQIEWLERIEREL
jgi:hypothetical protein